MSTEQIARHGTGPSRGTRVHSYTRDEGQVSVPESLMATCTPNSHPHEDGRVEHGFQINVLNEGTDILATIDLPDWESFHPASAGHRLIEHGYMIVPDARGPEAANGWRPVSVGWVTQVFPVHPEKEEC